MRGVIGVAGSGGLHIAAKASSATCRSGWGGMQKEGQQQQGRVRVRGRWGAVLGAVSADVARELSFAEFCELLMFWWLAQVDRVAVQPKGSEMQAQLKKHLMRRQNHHSCITLHMPHRGHQHHSRHSPQVLSLSRA